jgi:MFS family permease
MRFVDQLGRRPLMIGSAVALTVTMSALGGAFYWSLPPMAVVILLSAVMASYSVGVGPFSFLVASENLGLSERATGMTLCATVNRCMSGAVALTTVSLYEAMGDAGFFALYASIAALSICFYARSVPESTGLSLEELAARNRGDDCSITSMSISSDEANVESFKLFNANPSTFEIQLT